ncbi:MAG: class I SAM-dependent methyltransferase [Phycisphaerae bacterium]
MTGSGQTPGEDGALFTRAEWYERTINWSARAKRELPVLVDIFGPPGKGSILDAGCGTGRQACALAKRGYRVVGADLSEEMLEVARRTARAASLNVEFVLTPYAALHTTAGGGFDGVYCQGNALAAAGTGEAAEEAVAQFAQCLRPGRRLFVQVLNFPLMRTEVPCVRGPRVATFDGREYIAVRHFHFGEEAVQVTNVTIWNEAGWKCQAHTGTLYPVSLDQLRTWCESSGLRIDAVWGSYAREPFEPGRSTDLLAAATRV